MKNKSRLVIIVALVFAVTSGAIAQKQPTSKQPTSAYPLVVGPGDYGDAVNKLKAIIPQNYDAVASAYVEALIANKGLPEGASWDTFDGDNANKLYLAALAKKAASFKTPVDRFVFVDALQKSIDPTKDSAAVIRFAHTQFIGTLMAKAYYRRSHGQVDEAGIDYATVLSSLDDRDASAGLVYGAISGIASVKAIRKSPDALGWAKLCYLTATFASTQGGVNTVTQALRAADGNLIRANAFISAQKDPSLPNVLADVKTPDVKLPLSLSNVAAVIAGDKAGGLKAAYQNYVTANGNVQLNAAIDSVAQTLRDVDGNLIRANAYVDAQKNGTAFVISELQ
jgi:hypothetical protein